MSTRPNFRASPAALLSRPFPCLFVVRGDLRTGRSTPSPRGVRQLDYTIDGCPAWVAVNSRGDRVKIVKQPEGVDAEIVREWLWGYLERVDPTLRLL